MDKRVYLGSFKSLKVMEEDARSHPQPESELRSFGGFFYRAMPVALGASIIAFFSVAGIASIVVHLLK